MKRKTILSVLLMLGVISASAQTENPRGLYKLQKFFYDDGTEKPAPFEQYKYCGENAALTLFDIEETKELGTISFTIQNQDGDPLNYTGKIPVGEDGKGIQIYDSSKKGFKLRWFNNRFKNHIHFPMNSFVGETYTTKGIIPLLSEAMMVLTTKEWKSSHNMLGVWRRRGYTPTATGKDMVTPASEMYKIYTEKYVLCLYGVNNNNTRMACYFSPRLKSSFDIVYDEKGANIVHRVNDSTVTLTSIGFGQPEVEVWDRCGLPDHLQTLFGTNMPNTHPELIQPSASSVIYSADSIDVAPSFMGGKVAFNDFIRNERQEPEVPLSYLFADIEVSFIVERDGRISGCEVIGNSRKPQEDESPMEFYTSMQVLEAEAIRVMQLMPRWNPAIKDGQYVRSRTSRKITIFAN